MGKQKERKDESRYCCSFFAFFLVVAPVDIYANIVIARESACFCSLDSNSLNMFLVDSDDGDEGNEETAKHKMDYGGLDDVVRPEFDQLDYDEDVDDGEIKSEQVMFLICNLIRF